MSSPSIIEKTVNGFKNRSRYSRLSKAVDTRPLDREALKELQSEMVSAHRDWPENQLWKMQERLEKVLAEPQDADLTEILTEIQRGVNWELQSRNRAR